VIKKPTKIHSRARARDAAEAKAKGRHSGYGERHFDETRHKCMPAIACSALQTNARQQLLSARLYQADA